MLAFRLADRGGLGVLTAADIAEALREQGLDVPSDLGAICEGIDIGQQNAGARAEADRRRLHARPPNRLSAPCDRRTPRTTRKKNRAGVAPCVSQWSPSRAVAASTC